MGNIDATMGAILIGVVCATALWGAVVMQTWSYFRNYANDTRPLKLLVASVFTLDTTHQILLVHLLYTYLITGFGDGAALNRLVWSILVMVLITSIIALVVKIFLTRRIWIFSKSIPVVIVVLLLVFAEFGMTITYFVKAWSMENYSELKSLGVISRLVNALSAASDIGITLALIYYLWSSKSGFKNTDAIMDRLIWFCVRTGLFTTACAVSSLLTISVFPNTFVYIAFYCTIARFYSTSFLATLNARKKLRAATAKTGSGEDFVTDTGLNFAKELTTTVPTQSDGATGHLSRSVTLSGEGGLPIYVKDRPASGNVSDPAKNNRFSVTVPSSVDITEIRSEHDTSGSTNTSYADLAIAIFGEV